MAGRRPARARTRHRLRGHPWADAALSTRRVLPRMRRPWIFSCVRGDGRGGLRFAPSAARCALRGRDTTRFLPRSRVFFLGGVTLRVPTWLRLPECLVLTSRCLGAEIAKSVSMRGFGGDGAGGGANEEPRGGARDAAEGAAAACDLKRVVALFGKRGGFGFFVGEIGLRSG